MRLTLVDDAGNTSNMAIAHILVDCRPAFPGDFKGNGQVEQADLDLVLLHCGQDAASLPWTGPSATGLVDQNELDAVLLNWGAATTAVSTIPAQAPLIEASADATSQPAKAMGLSMAEPFAGKKPAKTPFRSPSERFDEDLGDDSSPSTKYA